MTPATGRILRHTGRAIEALCLLGLLSVYAGRGAFWKRHGLDPSFWLTFGFGFGILVWATGTYAIVQGRRGPGK
jgi:hypothetical protein